MQMAIVILLTLVFISISAFVIYFIASQKRQGSDQTETAKLLIEFQSQIGDMRQIMNQQMMDLGRQVSEHQKTNSAFLKESHVDYREAMGQMQSRLGQLHHATQTMVDIGKDISSLQDILKSPKLRGGLGELFLENLLEQILPRENFETQYSFKSGAAVDAVIKLSDGLIPIDAKFPLENFKRLLNSENSEDAQAYRKVFYQDVKKHIDSIASKYILPNEGTFDFAMMYIPAENIYYETIIKQENMAESVANYALKKKIIPVSPNSFYAYLQAIVRGLKGLRIEKSAEKVLQLLNQMESDLGRMATDFEKLGGHLSNAQSAYERTTKGMDKIRQKLSLAEENRTEQIT